MVNPRPETLQMPRYTPGRSVAAVQRERGLEEVIKLASNESLWGPSPNVLIAAQESLLDLYEYPEVVPVPLMAALSRHSGFEPENLLMGNGADELLRIAATAYVVPGDEIVFPTPSFAAYAFNAGLTGGVPIPVGLHPDGRIDLELVAEKVTPRTRLIYLCSPNNPTGGIFGHRAWVKFLNAMGSDRLIVVDQAYREYVDDSDYADVEGAIRQGRPVAMVRTFSKLYGLAGARIGWMAADPAVIDFVSRVREPFSLNTVAIAAATRALRDRTYYEQVRKETLTLRSWLREQLTSRGYKVLPSQANFLTFDCKDDAGAFAGRIEERGVIIRPTTSFGLARHCRVSIAPKPALERFLNALDAIS